MHRVLRGIAAAGAAIMLGAASIAPAAADNDSPNRGRYAALGDSYAAGVGLAPLRGAGDSMRSSEAYPVLLAGGAHRVTFLAESGATVDEVLAQVARMPEAARQVTLTVGGNDVGFVDVLTSCATELQTVSCQAALQRAFVASSELPEDLGVLLAAIRERAPQARIFVTGYPQLFQLSPTGTCATLDLGGFPYDPAALQAVDNAALGLNQIIKGTVAATALATLDRNLVHVDVTDEFAGMGACNPDGYIAPPAFYPGTMVPLPSSLHPTADGQEAYAEAIVDEGFTSRY